MTMRTFSAISVLAVAISLPISPIFSQESQPLDRGVIPSDQPSTNSGAGKSYLESAFGVSGAEADKRRELMRKAEALSLQLYEQFPERFDEIILQHQPRFAVLVYYSGEPLESAIRQSVDPELRSVLQFRRSPRTSAEIKNAERELITILGDQNYSIAFDRQNAKFDITVAEGRAQKIRDAIPANLKSWTIVREGPTPSLMQSGTVAGDALYGGWQLYDARDPGKYCTAGFVTRDSNGRQSILTAQHCFMSRYGEMLATDRNSQNNHVITLGSPVSVNYTKLTYDSYRDRSYDFRMMPIPNTDSPPSVWFWNPVDIRYSYWVHSNDDNYDGLKDGFVEKTEAFSQRYEGLPPSNGSVDVIGVISNSAGTGRTNPGHIAGDIRCKSGHTTGVTCGQIKWSSATIQVDGTTRYGFVTVSRFTTPVAGFGGDSGGAVFDQPYWSSGTGRWNARAAGLLVGGTDFPRHPFSDLGKRPCHRVNDGVDCEMNYMPIDRINDFGPATVLIRNGTATTSVTP